MTCATSAWRNSWRSATRCGRAWRPTPSSGTARPAIVADPAKVHPIDHKGDFFSVKGPLACVPSPQVKPVIIQAGASPRGIKASATFADHVFAASPGLAKQVKHRAALDAALVAQGRDPAKVGITWDVVLIVGETEEDAKRRKAQLLNAVPLEAVGAFLSHQIGYDLSKLPPRFTIHEINAEIVRSNASPVGFMNMTTEMIPSGRSTARNSSPRSPITPPPIDHAYRRLRRAGRRLLEEVFEATGERGGFMIAHPPGVPRDLLNVVDFLVPELQRRGRFRTAYAGRTLRENLED